MMTQAREAQDTATRIGEAVRAFAGRSVAGIDRKGTEVSSIAREGLLTNLPYNLAESKSLIVCITEHWSSARRGVCS